MGTWITTGNSRIYRLLVMAGAVLTVMAVGTGCASRVEERERGDLVPGEQRVAEQRVVTHPNGRYELRGEGTAQSPYYWVWIPSGAPVATVPAPPMTTPVVVTAPAQRVVAYPEGQYVLAGDGTTASPYYWVWVPTGATAPTPPPAPRRRQSP
jgi:hypothetical protein